MIRRKAISREILKSFGDDMRAISKRSLPKCVQKSALGETTGAIGGYTVPVEISIGIDENLKEYSLFHALATRFDMKSREMHVPSVDLNASHASGQSPLFGGMGLVWQGQNLTITETEPSFADARLVAENLQGLIYVSVQLNDDGGEALASYLALKLEQACEWAVEKACFVGVVGTPLGIVPSAAAVSVNRLSAGHVTQADIAAMRSRLLPACFNRSVWACNVSALADIEQLPSYQLNNQNQFPLAAATLASRPLFVTEKLPVMGTKGDLCLFDPSLYALGIRSLEIDSAAETATGWEKGQIVYRVIYRVGGTPMAKGTCVMADGNTAGIIVVLN